MCWSTRPLALGIWFESKELGLGVVNPCTNEVEPVSSIVESVRAALDHRSPESVFLNPDCGFGTFAVRPMNEMPVVEAKLRALVEAEEVLRR